jgi:hypothetical protein
MPQSLARKCKSCDSNWRPWSVVMVCGQPKRNIQPVKRARTTVSAVMFGMGIDSGQRVKRSTAVRQYVDLADVGSGPIRSMWTPERQQAFDACKASLSQATLLAHPNPSAPLALVTDASTTTLPQAPNFKV